MAPTIIKAKPKPPAGRRPTSAEKKAPTSQRGSARVVAAQQPGTRGATRTRAAANRIQPQPGAQPSASPKAAPVVAAPVQPVVRLVTVDEGSADQRLDNFLLRELKGVPKTHVYRIIRAGEVRVNKGRASADTRLALGDEVRIPPVRLPERTGAQAQEAAAAAVPPREFPVLFEDEHLLVVNKPAGVAVHGGSGVSYGVIEQLRRARPQAKFLELVHRLDKETSGLLMVAKKRSALTALQDQLRQRETGKTYAALVLGAWPASQKVVDVALHKFLTAEGERRVRAVAQDDPDGQRAISLVRVLAHYPQAPLQSTAATGQAAQGASLLDVTIKTGRTHQIRVHLASQGHPIVGDEKYGDFGQNKALAAGRLVAGLKFERMFLHARRLAFDHPASGQRIELQAPLPPECETLLAHLAQPLQPAA